MINAVIYCNIWIGDFSPLESLRTIRLIFFQGYFGYFWSSFYRVIDWVPSWNLPAPWLFLFFLIGHRIFLDNQTVAFPLSLFKVELVYTLYDSHTSRTVSIDEIKQVMLTKYQSESLRLFLLTQNQPTRSWHLPILSEKKIKALKEASFKVKFSC